MTPVAWLRNAALYVVAMLVLNASAAVAQDSAFPLRTRLSETAMARIGSDGVAGAVIVLLRNGEAVWTGAFGMADREGGVPMAGEALFRVESLSKPVTAWGTMRLAETGRLDLDAPATDCLRRWLPPEGTRLSPPGNCCRTPRASAWAILPSAMPRIPYAPACQTISTGISG